MDKPTCFLTGAFLGIAGILLGYYVAKSCAGFSAFGSSFGMCLFN